MTENEAQQLLEQALRHATAEHTELVLSGSNVGSTRFANNSITQNVAKSNVQLSVKSAFGCQLGRSRTNLLTPEGVRDAVRRAEAIARVAAPDTEFMPPPGPTECPTVPAWDDAVAECGPELRAQVVARTLKPVVGAGLRGAGSYATESGFTALLNSAGHRAYHRATSAELVCSALGGDSSGWASGGGWQLSQVDADAVSATAVGKALTAAGPVAALAKPTTVILEPAAVAELLAFMLWSLDAKAADEGRSAFTGKVGTRIAAPSITLRSEPAHPLCPGASFVEDGLPAKSVDWVREGVLQNLANSRYWASKSGRPFVGRPTNMVIDGGGTTVDEMVAATEEGLLVTRFWYIRFVDPMRLLLTGMTRDGLFVVRDGKVVGGAKNMRFNDSPLRVLSAVTHVGVPEVVESYLGAYVPALRVEGFQFTSGTEF
ncbi:MAG: TldD/PmbA family protein [Armatimonadetes bacterium]|nr:TldD/PmbA family protein [Armatimonadota bacterium]